MDEGATVITGAKSAAIVNVRGHHVLMLPGSVIYIAAIGEVPRVVLEQGRIFTRATMSGSSKMQFETRTAGFKVSNADMIIGLTRSGTAAVVAKGAMYAGHNVHDAEQVVKAGHVIVLGGGGGQPVPVSDAYLADLERLTRYFENPFSAPNRALITGEVIEKKKEEKNEPEKPAEEKPKPEMPADGGMEPTAGEPIVEPPTDAKPEAGVDADADVAAKKD